MAGTYRDLRVWQKAMALAASAHRLTESFPKQELYGLALQIRRAAVSVPSNIAEGKGRRGDRDFQHFLFIARGSLLELETQILLARELGYVSEETTNTLLEQTSDVCRSLNALINSLNAGAAAAGVE